MKKQFTTLVELMIMIPIFTIGIYVAIYFGEVTMTRINGAVASRYVSESTENIKNEDLAKLFTTERGKDYIDNGGDHFWATGSNVNIYLQDKAPGNWPVSENGSPHNVIHEYFIEYGFDIVNNYEINGGTLERTTSFKHPPGGLELMRWFLWAEADDVIEKVLQERITYSYSKVDYDYENDSVIPGSYEEIAKGNSSTKKKEKLSFSNEGRNLILLKNTKNRDFYIDINSVNRLTDNQYDYMQGNRALSDIRMVNSAKLQTGSGNTVLDVGGQQEISFTTDKILYVRQDYPLRPELNLDFNDIGEDRVIAIKELEDSLNDMAPDWAFPVSGDTFSKMAN